MAFLRLIRAKNLLIIALLQCLLRYLLVLPILDFYGLEPVMSNARFILLLVATLSLAASGYVINNYFDVKTEVNQALELSQLLIEGSHRKTHHVVK
jgi:4-hydroxybenzoate polyprenyltransferase